METPPVRAPSRNGHPARTEPTVPTRRTRVAIYARKSSAEGLDGDFSSLDAQQQACEQYIRTRGHEGWEMVETYVDAAKSGATTARPAFLKLIEDIRSGRVDVVCVYKVDRLSRSLSDFVRMLDFFSQHNVGFTSITQSFDTTDPAGRLTLHLLGCFSEFERSMTLARTLDKVAASKRQGRWCGGFPPLGYDVPPPGGRLLLNVSEAGIVHKVFSIFLSERSLVQTVGQLDRLGITRKTWTTRDGRQRGGLPFDVHTLRRLLRNPVYSGRVNHRGTLFPGQHEGIIDCERWEQAQSLLRRCAHGESGRPRVESGALLRGLLFCAQCGCRMSPTYTVKETTRYRYYVCQSVLKRGARSCPSGRVNAHNIEQLVVDRIRSIVSDPRLVAEVVRQAKAQLDQHRKALEAEQRQLGKDLKRERASLRRLAAGHSRNGDASGTTARLATIQERIETVERRLVTVARDLEAAKQQVLDERQVAAALSEFDAVWSVLVPVEQARILGLLVTRLVYDGRTQTLELALRPGGIGRLDEIETT